MIDLRLGDCLEVLRTLPDNSVDSIVTDPPYGLSFMNKKWDYDVPSVEVWAECLRVLKPGGHLLSFGGSRTYHRMAVAIEDAGFEVRDQIMWIYGSGFPKSHNIGKAIDKMDGKDVPTGKQFNVAGGLKGKTPNKQFRSDNPDYIKPVYDNEWDGWGTALKPAHEPICMARKPLSEKSIAENVLKWGTGGINIDGCRIGTDDVFGGGAKATKIFDGDAGYNGEGWVAGNTEGRFPANIMFDEEAGKLLDEQSGVSKSTGGSPKNVGIYGGSSYNKSKTMANFDKTGFGDKGGASRFFYCPKVSKKERNAGLEGFELKASAWLSPDSRTDKENYDRTSPGMERFKPQPRANNHPTVKPIKLMEYLITLVTPPNGVVLEPFMGSGSTGIAAKNLGMSFIGIEKEQEYFDIAKQRIGE